MSALVGLELMSRKVGGESDSTHWSELGSSHIQDQISISIGYSETKWCLGGEKMWVVV